MATEVGSLYYDLNIDDKKLKSQLDGAEKHVKSFGDKLNKHWDNSVNASKKILAGLTVATGAAVAFGVSSVKSFMESEKAQAALVNTLKSTNNVSGQTLEGMNKLAAQLQSTTGFTDEFVGTAQNMLLTFTQIGKDVFPQATKATLDMARQFGGDAQQNAIRLGKALNDPIQGVGALAKIGVQFSDVQKKQIENFIKAGDIMSAQKVILGEISTQTKGAAEAYGKTFAGQIDILKASFDDLKEGLGQLLVGALKPVTAIFSNWIKHVTEAGGFLEYFKGIVRRNKDTLIILAGAIVGALVPAVVALVGSFAGFLFTIAPWAALGAGVVLLFKKLGISMDDVADFAKRVWENIQPLIPSFEDIKNFGNEVVETLAGLWHWFNELPAVVQFLISPLAFMIASFDLIVQAAKSLADIFMTWFWPSIKAVGAAIAQNLWPALQQLWDAVMRLWNALQPGLMGALKIIGMFLGALLVGAIWLVINVLNIAIQIFSAVISVISNVIKWIANLIGWLGNLVGGTIHAVGLVINWFSKLPGAIGNIIGKIVDWFKGLAGKIGGVVGGVTDAVTAPFKAAFNAIARFWNNTVGKLSFTAPDWVPGIGGKGWSMPQLPILDTGGIITKPTIAMLAANSRPEAIVPLDQMGSMGTTINIGTIQDRSDADYILRRIDNNQRMQLRGVAPA